MPTRPVLEYGEAIPARKHGSRLHVLHISTAEELELFAPGALAGKRTTAETCVHFLHFNDQDYERLGFLLKCNPAVKTEADRQAIVPGIHGHSRATPGIRSLKPTPVFNDHEETP